MQPVLYSPSRSARFAHHALIESARAQGGSNDPDNLITLCSACHRMWHENREVMAKLAGA